MWVYIWKAWAEEYNLADIASQSVNPPSDEIKTVTITFDDTEPTWKSLAVNGGNPLLSVAQSTLNTIMVLGWVGVDLSQYWQSSSHTRWTVSYDFVQQTYSIDIIATIDWVDVPYQRNDAPLAGHISTIDSRDMTSSITLSGNIKIEAIPVQLDLKNAYIGEYVAPFTYDFTSSDWWWIASSWTSRDSGGFYRSATYSDGWITAPSEIYKATPKKIIISYNKLTWDCATWIWNLWGSWVPSYKLPYNYPSSYLTQMWLERTGGTSWIALWSNPTGNVDWEMDIDSTTTPRTITHSITWINSFTDNHGILDSLFENQNVWIRIINRWRTSDMYITWVTIEY